MSDAFDPSPRDTKRRRTSASHESGTNRTSADQTQTRSSRRLSSRLKAATANSETSNVDSAYASKEDSVLEESTEPDQNVGNGTTLDATAQRATSAPEIPETPANAVGSTHTAKRRQTRTPVTTKANGDQGSRKRATPPAKITPAASASKNRKTGSQKKASTTTKRKQSTSDARDVGRADRETLSAQLEIQESEDELQAASVDLTARTLSSRAKRAPRRYSTESQAQFQSTRDPTPTQSVAGEDSNGQALKGILTPSKTHRKKTQHSKSVAFNSAEKDIEQQLGFKDIEQSSKNARQTPKSTAKNNRDGQTPTRPRRAAAAAASATLDDVDDDLLFDTDQPPDILQTLTDVPLPPACDVDDTPARVAIKSHVLGRLASEHSLPPGAHLESQKKALTNLLTSTVVEGESNSLLLLGPRGAGKTSLLEHVLRQLTIDYSSLFHTVRLNGFFQTDDRLALREIWRQLGRVTQEADGEEAATAPISYADTLASLLSLLSHPDEMDVDGDTGMIDPDIDAPATTAKSVVIVLDEFDLFTLHPRQTLLYNLFDIAQSRKAPIAVIGCSTRMDVVESLEKRVKSRFSHRWLHIPAVSTLQAFTEMVIATLTLSSEGDSGLVQRVIDNAEVSQWNEYIKVCANTVPTTHDVN
jgi:origin recognition complex subunit 4